jgi:hypothetical protein
LIEEAKLLTTLNDHLFHLSHIWGNQGGFTAVKDLTYKVILAKKKEKNFLFNIYKT